jgi:hypothetical protein
VLGVALMMTMNYQASGVLFDGSVLVGAGMFLVPALTTIIALPAFTPTLSQFRLRQDQLLRCVAYASSGMAWIGVLLILGALCGLAVNLLIPVPVPGVGPWGRRFWPRLWFAPDLLLGEALGGPRYFQWDMAAAWFNLVLGVGMLWFGFVWWWPLLYVALRRYLQLDRRNALALFVSTQLPAVIVVTILAASFSGVDEAIGVLLLRLEKLLCGAVN